MFDSKRQVGDLKGAALTQAAFASAFPATGTALLTFGLILFAFTTILGWNYYGERCIEYSFGVKSIMLVFELYLLVYRFRSILEVRGNLVIGRYCKWF